MKHNLLIRLVLLVGAVVLSVNVWGEKVALQNTGKADNDGNWFCHFVPYISQDINLIAVGDNTVNFYVQGEIAETQTITDGKVLGYTPTATCEGKKFMGWSTVNQTDLIQDPASLDLFTDFSDKTFSATTDLYAVYAAYNGGKVVGEEKLTITEDFANATKNGYEGDASWITNGVEWHMDKMKIGENTKLEGKGAIYYYNSNRKEAYLETTSILRDVSKVTFDMAYTTSGAKLYVQYKSPTAQGWTAGSMYTPTTSRQTYTYELPKVGDYQIRLLIKSETTSSYLYLDNVKIYTKERAYWYSDYSTDCAMATSAKLTYVSPDGGSEHSVIANPVGETITISDPKIAGYTLDYIEIMGQQYNVGDEYILAHDVEGTAHWTQELGLRIVEWYTNKLLFDVPFKLTDITLTINGTTRDGDIETFSRKAGTTGYNLYELGGTSFDLAAAAGQLMQIVMTDNENKKYVYNATIPTIVTSEVNASTLTDNADVVVRDGGVLTINESKTLGDVAIYPTSKVSVPEGKNLTVDSLTLFGGIDEINGVENKYGVPQLSLKGTLTNTASTILYRMRMDGDQMYQVSFPYNVNVADITRSDAAGNSAWSLIGRKDNGVIIIETYNGASRAAGNRRTSDQSTWTDITSGTLTAGIGYTVSALPRFKSYPYVILDFPMAADFNTAATEAGKTAPVTAHDATNKYDKGWNLMGNPYMAGIEGTNAIKVEETSYDFVYIPTDDGEDFYQGPLTSSTLLPFKHFFLQVGESGTMSFDLTARKVPKQMLTENERTARFSMSLTGAEQTDITYVRIADFFSAEYDIPGDNAKFFGSSNSTKVYTLMQKGELAQIAISADMTEDAIPVGYNAPMEGEYTYALDHTYTDWENIEHIFLLENGEAVADLLRESYTFETPAGTNNDRFAIFVVMKGGQAPTSIFGTGDNGGGGPQKIIHHSMMYILMPDGRVYDAAGDQVNGKEVTK